LSLRLYLDDCAYSRRLTAILRGADYAHYVETPIDSGLLGADDILHFDYARHHLLIVVTKNPSDFEELHHRHPEHPGIFAVYQDNDPRDMTDLQIAEAIWNLGAAAMPIANQFHVLNAWRY
jgi:predicted nuclease of predicted toxin-antitoxin system